MSCVYSSGSDPRRESWSLTDRAMTTPKVSVIIPNYNHEIFLVERIDSVLNQTYRDFEVILLDDCSKDNSRQVIQRYQNHPLVQQTVFNEQNSGSTFKQWNKGVRLARGEYIWFAESDDVAEPDFLEVMVPVLDANPAVGVAKCQSRRIDVDGTRREIIESILEQRDWSQSFTMPGAADCVEQLKSGISIFNASAALVRKKTYVEAGWADETFKMAGDWMAWVRILARSDFSYVAKPLNLWREVHPDSARSRFLRAYDGRVFYEDLRVVRYIIENCPVDAEAAHEALVKHICRWTDFVVTLRGTHIPFRQNVRIFREAWAISGYTPFILVKQLLYRPVRAVKRRMVAAERSQ
jgi:glycosyltransferase involved in cell wall biosynthesis